MRKLFIGAAVALAVLMAAGCGGVNLDTEVLTDCVLDCVAQAPVVIVDAEGDTVVIYPGEYSHWIWKDDGTVELKGKK